MTIYTKLFTPSIVLKKVISAGAESDLIALPKRKNLIDALSSNKTTVP